MKVGWILIALVLVASFVAGEARAGSAESEIAVASRAFSDAYVRGDTTTIRNLYAEDAVLLPPGSEVRGRAKIARFFAPRTNRTNVSHAMVSSELKVVGDMAVDIGTWHNTWRIGDGEEQSASERYLVVWRRGADGRWRIEYDMWHRPES